MSNCLIFDIWYLVLFCSNKIFFTTEFLTRKEKVPFNFENIDSNLIEIYSPMSKFPFPVIASNPLCFLKFDFTGKLSDPSDDNFEFVTQGGFPITNTF